jgi:hypothetical protein
MAALLIDTYDDTDPERYADYRPGSLAEIMATDNISEYVVPGLG